MFLFQSAIGSVGGQVRDDIREIKNPRVKGEKNEDWVKSVMSKPLESN